MSATLVELELLLVGLAVEEVADEEVAAGGCVLRAIGGEPFCSCIRFVRFSSIRCSMVIRFRGLVVVVVVAAFTSFPVSSVSFFVTPLRSSTVVPFKLTCAIVAR
uniref:(northern house mosquito) hypothetical protein n=1 Tax=Culex pipiens TaxID=7175 RepID=A0A8D8BIP6_CULPI